MTLLFFNRFVCLGRSDSKIDIVQYDNDNQILSNNKFELPNKNLQLIKNYNETEFICLFKDTPMQVHHSFTNLFIILQTIRSLTLHKIKLFGRQKIYHMMS